MTADPVTTAPEVPGYLLADLLGRGGVGTVWAAMRLRDSAPVAVKVVAVGSEEQADLVARELAVLARVDVEGLVGFHEAIGLAGSPPSVALVLDRVDGGSLEGVVAARGHLSVGESVTILAPVARALAGLHGLGVVHGDVTPANVLLERTGQPLLADLGVASLVGEVPGQLYGTTGFVAPEVVDRGVVTTASDVYAVGALAWWCVTGQAPGPVALRRPLDELAVGLPAGWSEITRQALLGDPDARPSAAELALAYYDSAVCEPLRLVVGGDETSLLTQRLRQPAQVALPGTVPPTGSRRRRGLQACRAVLARAATRSLVGARLRAVDPRRLAAFGTAVLLLAGLVVGGLMVTDTIATPDWVRTSAGGRARPATPTRVANAVATDRTAPQRDPRGLMADLSHLRASVMMSGSATQLALLDAPGSPALAQDTAVLRDLAESGQTWQGVTLTVRSARSVSHTGTTATVDAVVETAAYRVVDVSGRTQLRPALAGQHLRFALVWSGGRWRIESITGPEV
jgi:hypothetical protein